jgi:glycosyltransferase involved in cell wall biosynthesis
MMSSTAAPGVSVIIPFFGRHAHHASLLDATLSTVDAQTYRDYEVIVVDDGSSIDVSDMVSRHRRTCVYRQDNSGCARARNHGIAVSRGECFVFLDADDYLLPDALTTSLAMLAAHPDVGFVVGPHEDMTFEGDPTPWPVAPPPVQSELYVPLLGFDWYIIPPSSVMFRRGVVEQVGGFRDPWGADDLDFYLRAARVAKAWCFQSPAVTRYRRYSSSSSRDGARMLDSIRVVYERQRPIVQGDPIGEAAFERGLSALTGIFIECLVENVQDRLRAGDDVGAHSAAARLASESPARWRTLISSSEVDVRGLDRTA